MPAEEIDSLLPAPAPLKRTSLYNVELHERGRYLAVIFGIPFFLTGCFLALTVVGVFPRTTAPDDPSWTPIAFPLIAIAFLGFGSAMLFGRRWLVIDLGTRSVVRRLGLLVPLTTQQRSLADFDAVALAIDPGDSDSAQQYVVRLRGLTGKDFVICRSVRFGDAYKQAEYLSRFLRLPLADLTTAHPAIVPPERAGDSLRDRLLASARDLASRIC